MASEDDTRSEEKLQKEIAQLRAATGFQPRAWLRENQKLFLVFAAYLLVVLGSVVFFWAKGEDPGTGLLLGTFLAPVALLRMYMRWKRLNR